MRLPHPLSLAAAVLIAAAVPGHAQWTYFTVPEGAENVSALAVIRNTVFCGSDSGAFRTADNGESWAPIREGLKGKAVRALLAVGENLFAGTDSGVFVSGNEGLAWTRSGDGLAADRITGLAAGDSALYANTDARGVFRSRNGGAEWMPIAKGLPRFASLAVHGKTLIGGADGSSYRSADGGDSWDPVQEGVGDAFFQSIIPFGTGFFAGSLRTGAYRSSDDGLSWSAVNNGLPSRFIPALIEAGGAVFAGTQGDGLFRFSEGGSEWSGVETEADGRKISSLAASDFYLFAGTQGHGIWERRLSDLVSVRRANAGRSAGTAFAIGTGSLMRSGTEIGFTLDRMGWVEMGLYDPSGSEIADLIRASLPAGSHRIALPGGMHRGLYFLRLRAGPVMRIQPLVLDN